MGSLRHQIVVLATGFALFAFSASALAADPPPVPPGTPSISQYVETVPTGNGGASTGAGGSHPKSLAPDVVTKLRARPDSVSKRLEEVATSPKYGAPRRNLRPSGHIDSPKPANPLAAAVSAVSDSGDSHLLWLLAAVLVVTTTMVWSTARRQRP